jgi:hypothetical protein
MLQNCARGARSFIFRERIGGTGEKERAIGPFFSPVAFLYGLYGLLRFCKVKQLKKIANGLILP